MRPNGGGGARRTRERSRGRRSKDGEPLDAPELAELVSVQYVDGIVFASDRSSHRRAPEHREPEALDEWELGFGGRGHDAEHTTPAPKPGTVRPP